MNHYSSEHEGNENIGRGHGSRSKALTTAISSDEQKRRWQKLPNLLR